MRERPFAKAPGPTTGTPDGGVADGAPGDARAMACAGVDPGAEKVNPAGHSPSRRVHATLSRSVEGAHPTSTAPQARDDGMCSLHSGVDDSRRPRGTPSTRHPLGLEAPPSAAPRPTTLTTR